MILRPRKFKNALVDAPALLKDEIEELKKGGYGMAKTMKLNCRIAAWKEQGWQHPFFQEVLTWRETTSRSEKEKAVPWFRMAQKVGGEANAKQMLQDGEIQAIPNPSNADGKPYYKMAEFHVERTRTLERQKLMGATKSPKLDEAEECEVNFGQLESSTFDLGKALELSNLPVFTSTSSGTPAALGSPRTGGDSAGMDQAMAKVNTALTNLIKMRLKVVQACNTHFANADHKKFIETKVNDKEQALVDIIGEYEFIAKHKIIKDHMGPTTPADLRAKLAKDSRVCSNIAALLQVASSFDET